MMSTMQAKSVGAANSNAASGEPPEIGRPLRALIGAASLLIAVWAAIGIVLSMLLPERAAWTFVGFEVVALTAGAVGVPFLRGAYRAGPAMAALCVAGAVGASAVLGATGVSWKLGTFSLAAWTLGRVAMAAVLALSAGWIVISRLGTWRTLATGKVLLLPVMLAALAMWVHGGRFDAVGMPLAKSPPVPVETGGGGAANVFSAASVPEPTVELSGTRRMIGIVASFGAAAALVPLVAMAGLLVVRRGPERELGVSVLAAAGLLVWPIAVGVLYLVSDGRVMSALPGNLDAVRQGLLVLSGVGALILLCAGGHFCIRAFEGEAKTK